MTITAHKNNHGKRIPLSEKLDIGLKSLSGKHSVVDIAQEYSCSRSTVYEQKERLLAAANKEFEPDDDNKVLYHLPVSKKLIHMVVVALFLICKSSYRDIIFFLRTIFHYHLSVGGVFNIIDDACEKSELINKSYGFESVKESAADELYHHNQPILAIVDIKSRFCPLLTRENNRDGDTWGVRLLELNDRGYAPETSIIDSAKGLIKGYEEALPNTKLRHDHFHMISDLKDCARFFKNKEASTVTATLKAYKRVDVARDSQKKESLKRELSSLISELDIIETTHKTFSVLSQWMQHDVLQLAGHSPEERTMLFDFIVSEMEGLAVAHPHRIKAIITSLKARRDALVDVADTLNDKFTVIADKHGVQLSIVWFICNMARYDMDGCKYNNKALEIEQLLGDRFDIIEDEVLHILESTHRCSSMVENFNSRLRPYLDERKTVTQKRLNLILFFLNHKPFMRSKHNHLVNKSPAEAMTGKPHKRWLEMLGFPPIKMKAA